MAEITITSKSRGHEVYWDDTNQVWRFSDNGVVDDDQRPCKYCGEPPTPEGYDACLGYLPGAEYACCGHGSVEDAYTIYTEKE